jgi:hypothetical protein
MMSGRPLASTSGVTIVIPEDKFREIANPQTGPGRVLFSLILLVFVALFFTGEVLAQPEKPPHKDAILLTIFLKHDQSKTLDEIQAQLMKNGFYPKFPPPGVEVVSWYVMMGIGQVVTLKVPAEKLRDVNLAIENSAWGPFRTEFYATYDYKPVWQEERKKAQVK